MTKIGGQMVGLYARPFQWLGNLGWALLWGAVGVIPTFLVLLFLGWAQAYFGHNAISKAALLISDKLFVYPGKACGLYFSAIAFMSLVWSALHRYFHTERKETRAKVVKREYTPARTTVSSQYNAALKAMTTVTNHYPAKYVVTFAPNEAFPEGRSEDNSGLYRRVSVDDDVTLGYRNVYRTKVGHGIEPVAIDTEVLDWTPVKKSDEVK